MNEERQRAIVESIDDTLDSYDQYRRDLEEERLKRVPGQIGAVICNWRGSIDGISILGQTEASDTEV